MSFMMFMLAVADLSETSIIDIGAIGLTSFIIFAAIGPKLWREFRERSSS